MPKITGSTIIKLAITCFLVGFALAVLNLDPRSLLNDILRLGKQVIDWSMSVLGWAGSYVLLGAVIVIPIWLLLYLLKAARGKR